MEAFPAKEEILTRDLYETDLKGKKKVFPEFTMKKLLESPFVLEAIYQLHVS